MPYPSVKFFPLFPPDRFRRSLAAASGKTVSPICILLKTTNMYEGSSQLQGFRNSWKISSSLHLSSRLSLLLPHHIVMQPIKIVLSKHNLQTRMQCLHKRPNFDDLLLAFNPQCDKSLQLTFLKSNKFLKSYVIKP